MAGLSIPTGAQLPSHLRIECTNRIVQKSLARLSRSSLLTLAISWTSASTSDLSAPRLLKHHLRERRGLDVASDDEEDYEDEFGEDAFLPARSLGRLRGIYQAMAGRKGPKSEVLGRITECDWLHGITLYQLAMADFQYLNECPLALKWAAYRVVPLKPQADDADVEDEAEADLESLALPIFHPQSFLQTLQTQVLPDVKVHYCFDRHGSLPVTLLRILVLDSPYNTTLALQDADGRAGSFDSSRSIYVAFPDSSPHVYISKAQTNVMFQPGDAKTLHNLIIEGIPKALSRPREHFTLKPTNLSTKNLAELVDRRGPNRTNRAGGGWSFYSDKMQHLSPLVTVLPTPPLSDESSDSRKPRGASRKRALSPGSRQDERLAKQAKLIARARFGDSNKLDDGKGVERVDIALQDPFPDTNGAEDRDAEPREGVSQVRRPSRKAGRRSDVEVALERGREAVEEEGGGESDESWKPEIRLTFHGVHVFAGIRRLVEQGIVDGERMPGWMTGQEGVTVGVVRSGRIRGSQS
ncbi:CHL4-domain-containing protein [Thozetella sp. PMI_491]|nr:CHL4-domain-containing protein [Thozetella sp. PMI_491]